MTLHCITQYQFLNCSFARNWWVTIGININRRRQPIQAFKYFTKSLKVPFYMEIIILMSWCIWTTRKDWFFNNIDPTVEGCRSKFVREFRILLHRAKKRYFPGIEQWLDGIT
jgi:hypothetical protein